MPSTVQRNANFLTVAHELADLSAKAVLPHFRRAIRVENKASAGSFDPVTRADKAAERAMRKHLSLQLPGHGIVGEEYADHAGDSEFDWVLDPIDGTRAFIMGYPLWGTLIGLLERGNPVLGMMDQPFTRERFWAAGKGSFRREPDGTMRRNKTRKCPTLADAVLGCTTPDMFKTKAERDGFAAVSKAAKMTRFGGDCYAYCLLAAGHVDLVIEASLKAVDIVALIPIIEEAGGRVTDWQGGPATRGGQVIAAGDPIVHAAALDLLGH